MWLCIHNSSHHFTSLHTITIFYIYIICRAEQSDTVFTVCLRVLLYNILTCYMLVHNASRTCGDIEGRCQTLPRRRWSGRRKPRFAGSSQRPSALIHNFCIPSRAAFGMASRDPVPVADRSRRERVDGLIGTDEPFDFDP